MKQMTLSARNKDLDTLTMKERGGHKPGVLHNRATRARGSGVV